MHASKSMYRDTYTHTSHYIKLYASIHIQRDTYTYTGHLLGLN